LFNKHYGGSDENNTLNAWKYLFHKIEQNKGIDKALKFTAEKYNYNIIDILLIYSGIDFYNKIEILKYITVDLNTKITIDAKCYFPQIDTYNFLYYRFLEHYNKREKIFFTSSRGAILCQGMHKILSTHYLTKDSLT
jgi:hypothetical protein